MSSQPMEIEVAAAASDDDCQEVTGAASAASAPATPAPKQYSRIIPTAKAASTGRIRRRSQEAASRTGNRDRPRKSSLVTALSNDWEMTDDESDEAAEPSAASRSAPKIRRVPIEIIDDVSDTNVCVDLDGDSQETVEKVEVEQEEAETERVIDLDPDCREPRGRLQKLPSVIELDDTDDSDAEAEAANGSVSQLLIYPPRGSGGIAISVGDFECLANEEFLNDVIIDFYLRYLYEEVLSDRQRQQTQIFSTFFYQRLVSESGGGGCGDDRKERAASKRTRRTTAHERHERVRNWTKNVNVFEKDFVFVPINEDKHWYLAVICFPGLDGPATRYGGRRVTELPSLVPVLRPCILILDSMRRDTREARPTITHLQDYLTCEYQAKFGDPVEAAAAGHPVRVFNQQTMPGCSVEVPQQDNYSDCGLFVLQFVEEFFTNAIVDYQPPIRKLAKWFDCMAVLRKREDLVLLLRQLIELHNPAALSLVPEIELPTKDGRLL